MKRPQFIESALEKIWPAWLVLMFVVNYGEMMARYEALKRTRQ